MTIESMNGWAGEYLAFLLIGAAVLLLLMFVLILVLFSKNKKLLVLDIKVSNVDCKTSKY